MIRPRLEKIEKLLSQTSQPKDHMMVTLLGFGGYPDEHIVAEIRGGLWVRQLSPKEQEYQQVLIENGIELNELQRYNKTR